MEECKVSRFPWAARRSSSTAGRMRPTSTDGSGAKV